MILHIAFINLEILHLVFMLPFYSMCKHILTLHITWPKNHVFYIIREVYKNSHSINTCTVQASKSKCIHDFKTKKAKNLTEPFIILQHKIFL